MTHSRLLTITAAAALAAGVGVGQAKADPYADEVLDVNLGGGDVSGNAPNDPGNALGPNNGDFYTLGDGGDVTLGFRDNVCLLRPGDDIRSEDVGTDPEHYMVQAQADGSAVGAEVTADGGGIESLDLADAGSFNEVVITDDAAQDIGATDFAGADIDFAECLFSIEVGDFTKSLTDTSTSTVELALDTTQQFSYEIEITNNTGVDNGLSGIIAFDVVPGEFNLDLAAEDANDGTGGDGCADGTCDGIDSDTAACTTHTWRPEGNDDPDKLQPEFITVDAGGLNDTEMCTVTVFVITDENPASVKKTGSGDGGDAKEKFEPTSCTELEDASGVLDPVVCDTITLNEGLKVFDRSTGDLLFGPKDSIQLVPILN